MKNAFTEKIKTINEKSIRYKNLSAVSYTHLSVDTPVLFTFGGGGYLLGYFAGFNENGDPMVFVDGKTSITAGKYDSVAITGDESALMLITEMYLQ